MDNEEYRNVSFITFVSTLISMKEQLTKEFYGWNDDDYEFLTKKMNLEKAYSRKLVTYVNKNNKNQIKIKRKYKNIAMLAEKYLNENDYPPLIKLKKKEYDLVFNHF